MIIKGLCKRYERWNPVHPTSGAFWGMGIGIGCGVGWGPGFGPDVVGYVGAGCGIGFNVGITFAGIGIGLPTNVVLRAPYNVLLATKNSMVEAARSSGLLPMGHVTGGSLSDGGSLHISDFQKSEDDSLSKQATVGIPRNMLSSHVKPVFEGLNALMKKLSERHHGTPEVLPSLSGGQGF